MKEHGFIFKGELIKAILAGRKTQTRRKPSSANTLVDGKRVSAEMWRKHDWDWELATVEAGCIRVRSRTADMPTAYRFELYPKWAAGDRMWVRESFYVQPELWAHDHGPQPIHYAAETKRAEVEDYVLKPSIHMPRGASRITRPIVRVWPDRIQHMSDAEAVEEGCPCGVLEFEELWNKINEKRGWDWKLNRPVWCVEFGGCER